MKKLLALFLSLVIVAIAFVIVPFSAGAVTQNIQIVSGKTGDFDYVLKDDGTVLISDYSGFERYVNIPDTLDGYKVTEIGSFAFYLTDIIEVTLSNNIMVIGDAAFANCGYLRKVVMSNNIESIGEQAFAYCYTLEDIHLPISLKSVGYNAFAWTRIWSDSYASSSGENLIYIDDVLCYAKGVGDVEILPTSVVIKDGTRIIADQVFDGHNMLESVELPSSLVYIGDAAFQRCTKLSTITIPENVLSLGECAFWGCESLVEVILSDSITSMESGVFYNCTKLQEITLPKNFIGTTEQILAGCNSLENIYISSENYMYTSVDGILYSKDISTLVLFPCGRTYNCDEIPKSVKIFGDYAFAGNHKIKDFIFPEGIECVGVGFIMDSDIENIVFPDSVRVLREGVTYGCQNLNSVTILNPECEINSKNYTIYNSATIYGYNNSTAQEYANNYNRTFVSLGEVPTVTQEVLGDVDGDNEISVMDATAIQRHLAKAFEISEDRLECSDTDKDGEVSVLDATRIQRFIAQLIPEL